MSVIDIYNLNLYKTLIRIYSFWVKFSSEGQPTPTNRKVIRWKCIAWNLLDRLSILVLSSAILLALSRILASVLSVLWPKSSLTHLRFPQGLVFIGHWRPQTKAPWIRNQLLPKKWIHQVFQKMWRPSNLCRTCRFDWMSRLRDRNFLSFY